MSDKFSYTYTAPTAEERREIEDIRKKYLPPKDASGTPERLRALDKKARTPALAAGITLGVAGTGRRRRRSGNRACRDRLSRMEIPVRQGQEKVRKRNSGSERTASWQTGRRLKRRPFFTKR